MQIGMVGTGRMGAGMARRLLRAGQDCVVYDRDAKAARALASDGARIASSLGDLASRLKAPRAVWIMLPAGTATEEAVQAVSQELSSGDAVIDGGNSFYQDDIRRAEALAGRGIDYLDAGTSGGVWGLERGYCLMVGGERGAFERLEPVFKALAPGRAAAPATPGRAGGRGSAEEGYLHCGPAGSGHFVKMIHNGIEYGLMQAYAEGFDILRGAKDRPDPRQRYALDLAEIAELWRRGSVVGSWLLDLTAAALAEDPALASYEGVVQDSGEGRWTLQAAVEQAVPAETLAASLFARFRSRRDHTFAEKLLSAMRRKFGGHAEPQTPSGP